MLKLYFGRLIHVFMLFYLIFLFSCSGGSGDENKAASTFTISGTIRANENNAMDSDVNDPFALYTANDTFRDAQEIPNPVTLCGYVNVAGAGPSGRSKVAGDRMDIFKVKMALNQALTLYTADPDQADLDLYLYDETGNNLLDFSVGTESTEYLQVTKAGTYLVTVYACSFFDDGTVNSASNYTLVIGQTLKIDRESILKISSEFVNGEAIVRFRDDILSIKTDDNFTEQTESLKRLAKGGASGRALLLDFTENENKQQTFHILGINKESSSRGLSTSADSRIQDKIDTLRIIKALRNRSDVLYAEPNYIRRCFSVPNDDYYRFQWHYPLIQLPQAWDLTTGDGNVIIAVIDTGVLLDHPDLQGQLVAGYDFIRDPANALDGDGIDTDPNDPGDQGLNSSSFHGTHVAGIVAATMNNEIGGCGVAGLSRIMPLRVIGKNGATSYDIQQAVRYAAGLANDSGKTPSKRADIINLSLGGPSFSQIEQDVYTAARNEGVIIIAAAGNESTEVPLYPAAYDGIVSVNAVDMNADLTPYSNYGSSIDVAAPGGDISQDVNGDGYGDGILSAAGDNSAGVTEFVYKFLQGTSMASPHVAGIAALMQSVNPNLTPEQFDLLLKSGNISLDIGEIGWDNTFGFGLIDAYRAVVAARNLIGDNLTIPAILIINPMALNFGATLNRALLSVQNGGGETLTITDVVTDAQWLSVETVTVDDNGLGKYSVEVDRGEMAPGTYTATISFMSSVNMVEIAVIMEVRILTLTGDLGYQYILLVKSDTGGAEMQVESQISNGEAEYYFQNVNPGSYQIFAGTDINNDGYIGDAGEALGAFITIDQPMSILVDGNRSDLDFYIGLNWNLPAQYLAESTTNKIQLLDYKMKRVSR
ncbi:MAG: S8 family peptidase [Desulfobacterales bacterium]|nr:S8 family peptidase [Desulfobacterales bacterium]